MLAIEDKVARHYTHGSLNDVIHAGLEKMHTGSESKLIDLLAGVDEFHMGGRPETRALAERLDLKSGHRVLDVGCGLGGTARYLASTFSCQVSGVDLTTEYVEVGNQLNKALGMGGDIDLSVASATDMPFSDNRFDRASMLHVGMNIADKAALMAEVGRVLKPGGLFAIFDVMRIGETLIEYPVAWAADESTSFVGSVDDYTKVLDAAGFDIMDVVEKRDMALNFFAVIKERMANGSPPPLGLHIVMGSDTKAKVANMHANVENGAIAPVQILARRR
jgi:MPBQ/MSBQ methyltransferase